MYRFPDPRQSRTHSPPNFTPHLFHHKKPPSESSKRSFFNHNVPNLNHTTKQAVSQHKTPTTVQIHPRPSTTHLQLNFIPHPKNHHQNLQNDQGRFVQSTTTYQISTIFRSTFGGLQDKTTTTVQIP